MSLPITIVPTRVANLASVRAAFRRAESEPRMATSPAEVLDAAAVLLPGVGSFDAAIGPLRDAGYAGPVILLAAATSPELRRGALDAGATGVLVKASPPALLHQAAAEFLLTGHPGANAGDDTQTEPSSERSAA